MIYSALIALNWLYAYYFCCIYFLVLIFPLYYSLYFYVVVLIAFCFLLFCIYCIIFIVLRLSYFKYLENNILSKYFINKLQNKCLVLVICNKRIAPSLFEDRTSLKRRIQSNKRFWHPSFTGCQQPASFSQKWKFQKLKCVCCSRKGGSEREIMDTKIVYRS